MRDGLFEPREKTKNLERGLYWFCGYCNPLKSHKTAKGNFGKAWRKQAEIWKSLQKRLGGRQTRPGDAGPPFAMREAQRGNGPPFVGQAANFCSARFTYLK